MPRPLAALFKRLGAVRAIAEDSLGIRAGDVECGVNLLPPSSTLSLAESEYRRPWRSTRGKRLTRASAGSRGKVSYHGNQVPTFGVAARLPGRMLIMALLFTPLNLIFTYGTEQ